MDYFFRLGGIAIFFEINYGNLIGYICVVEKYTVQKTENFYGEKNAFIRGEIDV